MKIKLNEPHEFIFSTTSVGNSYTINFCKCGLDEGNSIHTINKNAKNNKIHKEGFDAGYKKGYKDGLKNVSGWSKEYEKMMLENL